MISDKIIIDDAPIDYKPLKMTRVNKHNGVVTEGYGFIEDGNRDECWKIDEDAYELRFEFPDEDIHVGYNRDALEALKKCIEAVLWLPSKENME